MQERDFPLRERLNPDQWRAVTAGDGHLVINAAAGTGKTTTVAARILYLQLVRSVSPESTLAVTFSRAARGNLTARLAEMVQVAGRGAPVRTLTLHGLSYSIIRTAIGLGETWLPNGFEILVHPRDGVHSLWERHQGRLLAGVRDTLPADERLLIYARAIDLLRQGHRAFADRAFIKPAELEDTDGTLRVPYGHQKKAPVPVANIRRVWERYDEQMRREKCIDYPGMVSESLRLLYESESTVEAAQRGLRYLIVDEFQDTSVAHMELVQVLAGEQACVNVVGDDDQAIYTFNGSDVRNIRCFPQYMSGGAQPVLEAVDLVENYRSSPNILAAANRILERAGSSKRLRPAVAPLPEPLEGYRQRSLPVKRVLTGKLETAAAWVAGEIRRLVEQERVQPSEIAVLVRKDTEYSGQARSVLEALTGLGLEAHAQQRDPQQAAAALEAARQLCQGSPTESVVELARMVRDRELDDDLAGATPEAVAVILDEAAAAGARMGYQAAELLWDKAAPEATPPDITGVQVRTIHSAKGLEFRIVFLMYLGDGEFPATRYSDVDEERRLLYVGITRAQERLYVIGRPGINAADFFGEVAGEGTELVRADPTAGDALSADAILPDAAAQARTAAVRRRQQESEAERWRKAREEAEID